MEKKVIGKSNKVIKNLQINLSLNSFKIIKFLQYKIPKYLHKVWYGSFNTK